MGALLTKILRRKESKGKYDLCAKASTYGFPTESSDNIDRTLSENSSSEKEKASSIINDYKNDSHPQPKFTLYQHSGSNLSTSSQLLAEINNERKRREARKLKMQIESGAACCVGGNAMDDSQDNENDKSIQSNQSLLIEPSPSPSPPKTVPPTPPFINLEKIPRRSQAKSIGNCNLLELGEEECHIRGIVKPKFMTIRKGTPPIVSSSLLNNENEW